MVSLVRLQIVKNISVIQPQKMWSNDIFRQVGFSTLTFVLVNQSFYIFLDIDFYTQYIQSFGGYIGIALSACPYTLVYLLNRFKDFTGT